MLTRLDLHNFKNFKEAQLNLGSFTVLVGTNASGKSNLRDAFRFLHGIGRGYSLAEIFGQKWGEGGELQWYGLRGGAREAAFSGSAAFGLEASFSVVDGSETRTAVYHIAVNTGESRLLPHVAAEELKVEGREAGVFTSGDGSNTAASPRHLPVRFNTTHGNGHLTPAIQFPNEKPVLSQVQDHPEVNYSFVHEQARQALETLRSVRFLDLHPDAMREPCFPGQTVLGDRGENLSAVLQTLCEDDKRKHILLEWIRELTPMDVKDFEFPTDQIGRILVTFLESDGSRTSAYSASDGTLRFLALAAGLLFSNSTRLFFIEELDNGIHPARLYLLVQLIERAVKKNDLQVVATTHSPLLLAMLSEESLQHANLVYRLAGTRDGRIRRILDLPEAARVVKPDTIADLISSGWLENAAAFMDEEVPV